MNQLIPANFGQLSNRFAQTPVTDDLSSGIQSSFGLVGYKGKVWSIRYRGEDTPLMRDDGDGAKNSIESVILRASPVVSKVWYEQGYVEGSTAPPDCFSNNGVTPEATSAKPQCATCALCPHNQWGSRLTPAGKAGKSCADSKRLAIVPAGDLNNEAYGGPMLLRVPAASLQDLAMYGQKMQQMGYPYYSISTKISFDPSEAYPKFVFGGLRPLTDDEADLVLSMRDSHAVSRILSENEYSAATPSAPAPTQETPLFEQAPNVGARQAQPDTTQAQPTQAQTTQAQPTQAPAATPSVGDQARAAAATQAQQRKPAATKAAVKPVEPVKQAEPEKPAEPAPDQTVAINPRFTAFLKAGLTPEQAKATIEAMGESVTMAPNAEPAAAPAKAEQVTPKVIEQEPVKQAEAAPVQHEEQPGVAQASDFEDNLDAMLADLLPSIG